MGYQPRHALASVRHAVQRLSWKARAGGAIGLAASATLLGATVMPSAGSAAVAFTTPPTAGVVTELVLDNGGYTKCVNDYGQNHVLGAPVKLYTCNASDPASQWVTFPDGTLRPYTNTNLALTVDSSNRMVLGNATGMSARDVWFIRDDGTLVSELTTAGTNNLVLNDPAFATANGTQLILWDEHGAAQANEHFWVTKARYAVTTLSNRPDSGGNGNWANDHMSRASMVLLMGGSPGNWDYQSSVYDTGSFHGLAGAFTPNQDITYKNDTQADSSGGTLVGFANYHFTASSLASAYPPATGSGSGPSSTGNWPKQFFAVGAVTDAGIYNDGAVGWHWGYMQTTADNCGVMESWLDSAANSGGQVDSAGNIFGGSGTGTGNVTCTTVTSAARPSIYGD